MFDLDGTLVLRPPAGSYQALPGAADVLNALEGARRALSLLTNGSAYPAAKQGPKLRAVGLPIVDEHLFTPNSVAGQSVQGPRL